MILGILFFVCFSGIIIAIFQDFYRREIDNWLNYSILAFGIAFVLFEFLFIKDVNLLYYSGVSLIVLFLLSNLFYYARVFGGGDAKLLFCIFAFFAGAGLLVTLINIGFFIIALFFSGAIYGLIYCSVLYFKNRKKVNRDLAVRIKKFKYAYFALGFLVLFALGFFYYVFFVFAGLVFVFPLLYCSSKSLESVVFIKSISGKLLREGDWLVNDIKIGNKTIKSNFEGLTKKEVFLLRNKDKIKVKDGIPFAPAFLIAFLIYTIYAKEVLAFILGFLL